MRAIDTRSGPSGEGRHEPHCGTLPSLVAALAAVRRWWADAPRQGVRPSEARDLTRASLPVSMLPPSLAGPVVNERNALCLAPVWAAVRVLSFTAASCPLLVYRRVDDTSRVRWDGPPAPLLRRPSPTVTPSGFVATCVSHLALSGNCFIGLFRNADGVVEQVVPLEPESIVVNVIGGLVFYEWSPPDGGELRTLTTEDLC